MNLAFMLLALPGCAPAPGPASTPVDAGWSATAQASIAAGEYAPQPGGEGFEATNRAQSLRARFDRSGITLTGRDGANEVRLSLLAWGRTGAMSTPEAVAPEEGGCLPGPVDAFGECLHRIDYVRVGVTEWWANQAKGIEQGFTVTAPPGGDGELVFDLGVTGASVELNSSEAILRRPAGEPLRYAGLVAIDERGRELPSWMEETDAGLRLVVDDSAAIGTITVDPVITTASWTAEANQATAYFGQSAAAAGDVNGDGYGDVIIGAMFYDNGQTDEGRAYVYMGSASGLGTSASWTVESNQASSRFGSAVGTAGDVNGDGYADVVVGASAYDNGSTDEGRAYVYLGSASGLSTTASWTAESDQATAGFGNAVGSAGDVNGDGYADLVVGAYNYTNGSAYEGRAFVYLGSSSGLSTTAAWTAESDQVSASFGIGVGSAGDVNGDGYGDVIIGANAYDGGSTDEGRASVYLGSSSGLASAASWTAESDQASAYFGYAVASVGDVNGDGYGDIAIGAYLYDNGSTNEGRAYLYLGSSSGPAASAAWTAEPDQASAIFGYAVGSAGDVNGDGYGDVM